MLGERADSIRKGVTDPYGSHIYTLWRVHGWRMSLYSLARALRTHGDTACLHVGPFLLIRTHGWRPGRAFTPSWLLLFVPFFASKSAWRCPPSVLFCCLCPVMHVLKGSHGAVILCARRLPTSWRRSSTTSAASGFVGLGLLLCGALAHRSTLLVSCWRSARRFLRVFRAFSYRMRQRSHGLALFLTPRLRGGSISEADLASEGLRLLQHEMCSERARSGQSAGTLG